MSRFAPLLSLPVLVLLFFAISKISQPHAEGVLADNFDESSLEARTQFVEEKSVLRDSESDSGGDPLTLARLDEHSRGEEEFAIDPHRIPDATVLRTIVGGVERYTG